ncbi:MAG: hypothetical protein RSE24_04140 [Oscillospiraceae bacterium]
MQRRGGQGAGGRGQRTEDRGGEGRGQRTEGRGLGARAAGSGRTAKHKKSTPKIRVPIFFIISYN